MFQRLEGATGALSIAGLEDRLSRGLNGIDSDVLAAFATLLPAAAYLPVLLRVTPRLVTPAAEGDYFVHEQVATWGLNGSGGLPENPRTPYYRTFETPISASAHLYEFVVPMVPPAWNDRARVQRYSQALQAGSLPAVVAVSTLDISQPASGGQDSDDYEHWALIHFILDGHHKLEAAAAAGRPLQLLSLIAIDASLARKADILRLPAIRAQTAGQRRRPLTKALICRGQGGPGLPRLRGDVLRSCVGRFRGNVRSCRVECARYELKTRSLRLGWRQ